MAQSRKTHPYNKFEGSVLWQAVDKAIAALVSNGDVQHNGARIYSGIDLPGHCRQPKLRLISSLGLFATAASK